MPVRYDIRIGISIPDLKSHNLTSNHIAFIIYELD